MAISNKTIFLLLIVSQTLHSLEEYFYSLWEVFPPARIVSGLISSNLTLGFAIINSTVVAVGFWCYFFPVRNHWKSATVIMWFWVLLELANAIGHAIFALQQGGYFPGLITALPLFLFAGLLAIRLVKAANPQ